MADERDISAGMDDASRRPVDRARPSGVGPWRDDAHAVVIGINTYLDAKIPDLRFARQDAEAVYRVLTDPGVGRFKPENVTLLVDAAATQRAIRGALGTKLSRQAPRESTVCIYYAGHGAPEIEANPTSSDGIEKYLVPHDAQADDLFSSGISMEAVHQCFLRLAANQVVCFLDCCYSGAAGGRSFERHGFQKRALLSDEFLDSLASEGRLVVTACATNEVSLESEDKGHGLFTHYLVEGLKGAADRDGNGRVTIDELYDFVYHEVEREARAMGGSMKPVRKGSVQGRVYLTEYESPTKKRIRLSSERGDAAWARGDLDDAAAAWNEALALDPAHELAKSGLARLAERKALEQAALAEAEQQRVRELKRKQRILLGFFESDELLDEEYPRALELLERDPQTLEPLDRRRRKLLDRLVAGTLTPKAYRQSLEVMESEPWLEKAAALLGPISPTAASGASASNERPVAAVGAWLRRRWTAVATTLFLLAAMAIAVRVLLSRPEQPVAPAAAAPTAERFGLPDDPLWGFVEIPSGAFRMGNDAAADPQFVPDELPPHVITLPGYFISKYEVTVGQYKACQRDAGCRPGDGRALDGPDDRPARWLTWHDAMAYANWVDTKFRSSSDTPGSIADALNGRRDGQRWRITLPSEAEWERAARGAGPPRRYPWGDADVDLTRANYRATGTDDVMAVGSFVAGRTPEGIFDLAGNVWEWTRSLYKKYPYTAADGRENLTGSGWRVLRGGSFERTALYQRAAFRSARYPASRSRDYGFRIVCTRDPA